MGFHFPYVSIDIETTGLDRQKSHVLQLAAVYDNGEAIENLPTFNKVVKWPIITYGEEYAMNLNRELLLRAFRGENVFPVDVVRRDFTLWLKRVQPDGRRLTAAGKNVQGFDFPILKNSVNAFPMSRFQHRCLDPGSMYYDEFDHIPNLDEINKVTGRGQVSHDALDDAFDVVYAIRYKWGL